MPSEQARKAAETIGTSLTALYDTCDTRVVDMVATIIDSSLSAERDAIRELCELVSVAAIDKRIRAALAHEETLGFRVNEDAVIRMVDAQIICEVRAALDKVKGGGK